MAGCGGMSNTWLDYVAKRENAEIVGLVDIYIDAAKNMAERRGLNIPVFTNLAEAIEKTDANLVFDVTIPASHKTIVTTALEGGCNVFGEKPMAEAFEDAKELVNIVNKSGKRYAVMQNRRYNKQIRAFKQIITNREIGHVGSIHADFFLGPHFGGFREAMESPLIVDMAIHTFDQARFISGANPVSVYCHEYNPKGSWYKGNASAVCIFEMDNGAVFTYRGSWSAEGFPTSWEADWRVIGENGTARWDGTNPPSFEIVDQSQDPAFFHPVISKQVELTWSGNEGHHGCLDEMFLALEQSRLAETDCSDNIYSMAMVFAALESAKTGRKVSINQDLSLS